MFDNGGSAGASVTDGVNVQDGVKALVAAMDALARIDTADLPGAGVGEVVVAFGAQLRRGEALQAR